jgi:glycosyltransferase involved in cell wall biosynthesis
MISVLFICPNLKTGGAERHWAILIPALVEHGIQPSVQTLDGTGPFFDQLRTGPIEISCARLRNRCDIRRLAGAVRRGAAAHPRVIVSMGASPLVVGQLIARQCGARHLYNAHNCYPLDARRERIMSLVAPRTSGVVAISEMQRRGLEALGFRGQCIWIVANGVPVRACAPPTISALRADLGLTGGFCAALVAALRPEKDVEMFVRAIGLAAADGVTGVVVGDGPERPQLESFAAEQRAPVRFLGSRTDAVDVMAISDVVCLSSRFEGVPMALLEAMSVGRPVVATDVGAVKEIVVHEQTGLLVAPGDTRGFAAALQRLVGDPPLRSALGAEARRRQRESYSSTSMIEDYAHILREMACLPHR